MTKKSSKDQVQKPSHYQGSIEVIDMILSLGYKEASGFLRGNAIKYVMRADRKGGTVDARKAIWYMELWLAMERWQAEGNDWSEIPTARKLLEKYGGS